MNNDSSLIGPPAKRSQFRENIVRVDMFRPQTAQLIELYFSKPLEEQDAVDGTRFKTKNTHRNRWRANRHQIKRRIYINRPHGCGEKSQASTTISIASGFSKISMDFPH
jgi:hypothetical protein